MWGEVDAEGALLGLQCFLLILGIVLVAGIVNPYVFIPTVPLVALFFYIRHYYLSTSRSIKRLEGTCECVCMRACVRLCVCALLFLFAFCHVFYRSVLT